MREIRKLYFMFHPVCWAHGTAYGRPGPDDDPERWSACLEWEREVNQRQCRFISAMKPDEALVLFPIGQSEAMKALERHANEELRERCIIVGDVWCKNAPAEWGALADPIERFLTDANLEGRAEFLDGVPPEIQEELAAEIREACEVRGFGWNISALKVVYYSRVAAAHLEEAFRAHGWSYDAAAVASEAFGEGFEQCAMTWKAMLVPYLGLARPAENIFELSVSGAPFLAKARLRERVAFGEDVRLFLWEGADGRWIALYARAWCRLSDPQFIARVPVEGMALGVWDVARKRWPAEDSPLYVGEGHMRIPVLNGIRRDDADAPSYLVASGVSYDEFRSRVVDRAELRAE